MARKRSLEYKVERRKRLAELVRLHGVSPTREMLNRWICAGTLLKFAKEFGVELKQGRRPRKAA